MKKPVGVVIGRFQVPRLHKGHRHLLRYIEARHRDRLVLLGTNAALPTPKNPLSFALREHMIATMLPGTPILALPDHPSDAVWSETVDALIEGAFPSREAVLYGSRDSFLKEYSGKHTRVFIPPLASFSGSDVRTNIRMRHSEDFRRGVIYAHTKRSSRFYPTVDIAVLNPETEEVLLCAKLSDGEKMRFVGGFVDASDPSWEHAALRELAEETTLTDVSHLTYIGSTTIEDWRYKNTGDGITTTFFCVQYVSGTPEPRDDIARLAWVPYARTSEVLAPGHAPLGDMLLSHIAASKKRR